MQPLKAHVRNGRLVLDEPTDLPEGTEVTLAITDDELDDEERARVIASIERPLCSTSKLNPGTTRLFQLYSKCTMSPDLLHSTYFDILFHHLRTEAEHVWIRRVYDRPHPVRLRVAK